LRRKWKAAVEAAAAAAAADDDDDELQSEIEARIK
jgi:hypothetical protein